MATARELHEAIADVCAGINGLRTSPAPPQGMTPPVAFPVLTRWQPETFGRTGTVITVTFDLYVITSTTVRPADGYLLLQEFIDWSGPKSLYLAIWDANSSPAGTFHGLANTQVVSLDYRPLELVEMDALQGYGGVLQLTAKTKEES